MERPYAVLHNKLTEIESQLSHLSAANLCGSASSCNDMAGKIDFLKALLGAEMEAHGTNMPPPPHIQQLVDRLRRAEGAVRNVKDGEIEPCPRRRRFIVAAVATAAAIAIAAAAARLASS